MNDAQHKTPTAWLPVARNVHHYECGNADEPTSCRHRSPRAVLRCRKGTHVYGRLINGGVIRVSFRGSSASNGESAVLPYPTTREDYDKAVNGWRVNS